MQVNNQLASTLADDRFITAFIGLLDVGAHRMRFHSGGQAPILHFQAATGDCARHDPTSFPLAAMPLTKLRPAVELDLPPGDILVLLSDGIYEYHDASGEQFGERRVEEIVRASHGKPMAELSALLLDAVRAFARGAPQEDDITIVLVKRAGARRSTRAFPRSFDSLEAIFAFTRELLCAARRRRRGLADRRLHGGGALHEHGQVQPGGGRPEMLDRHGGRSPGAWKWR